jgi:hypothetical protein
MDVVWFLRKVFRTIECSWLTPPLHHQNYSKFTTKALIYIFLKVWEWSLALAMKLIITCRSPSSESSGEPEGDGDMQEHEYSGIKGALGVTIHDYL